MSPSDKFISKACLYFGAALIIFAWLLRIFHVWPTDDINFLLITAAALLVLAVYVRIDPSSD